MIIETYKKHRIRMERRGDGWQAMINPPDTNYCISGPLSDAPTSYKVVLMKAKELIDRGAI